MKHLKLNHILNSQTKSVTFAAFLLSLSSLISRLLGFLRNRILASQFGAGEISDIYFASFRIPDFVYGILITGGIAAVFLPIFSEHLRKDEKEAWKLANNVLNCFLVLLLLLCVLLAIFTPFLVNLIAPGFSPEAKAKTAVLTRIMFLSPIFLGASSIFSGVLHYFDRFLIYSLAPILYNIGIILGILFLYPIFGILGLGYGVILGAFLHWIVQIPIAKNLGFTFQPCFNLFAPGREIFGIAEHFKSPAIMRIFRLMAPRTIGVAAYQLNLIVITAIGSTLIPGSITIFNFSEDLHNLPVGLIGLSFAIAAFPLFSRLWAEGKKEKFSENFSSIFQEILFLITPISVLMFILRAQVIRLILGTGQFGWLETRLTAASLGLFCFGIFASTLIPFLARVFYSFHDTKTPVVTALISVSLNIILAFFFVWFLGFPNFFQNTIINFLKLGKIEDIRVLGLPLAFSISGILQFFLLFWILSRKIEGINFKGIFLSLKKIIAGTFLMGFSAFFSLRVLSHFVNMKTFLGVFWQTLGAGLVGAFVYILTTWLLKSPEIKTIKSSILKQFTPTPNQRIPEVKINEVISD